MENRRSVLLVTILSLLVVMAVLGILWANFRFALNNPGGGNFLSAWVGTRYFLLNEWSPYSDQTSQMIKTVAEGSNVVNEDSMFFVYPFYSILLFAPFSLIGNYEIARSLWMMGLQLALLSITGYSLSLTKWKPQIWLVAIFLLFSLFWFHGLGPTISGDASILVTLFLTFALVSIQRENDIAAGIWFALSTIKPQMVALIIPLAVLWTISRKRWRLLTSFFSVTLILTTIFSFLIPNWIFQNLYQILALPANSAIGIPREIFSKWIPGIGNQLGWLLTISLALILIVEWRAVINKEFYWFFWTSSLTLVVTNLVGIPTATDNYVVMIPALVLLVSLMNKRWGRRGSWLILLNLIILLVGLWIIFLSSLEYHGQLLQSSIMFFPLPVYLLIMLYWLRWWAIKPPRVLVDQIRTFIG
ncbi:MAG: DUF2029 domain-containing protein [Anaerolineales bacterium]|nr:MAG: DUF2029 domain-containing protein [Anaerolineales bacterium]